MYNKTKHKQEVLKAVAKRRLTSLMNNTKWQELVLSISNDLQFPPPYQRKDVLIDEPEPETFDRDVWYHGDWVEGIHPFFSIEWIRIRPRYLKSRGKLVKPDVIDEEKQVLEVLKRHSIPFVCKDDSIWIYGYCVNTSDIIK